MLSKLLKLIASSALVLGIFMVPTFAAKIIVQPVQQQLFYGCPFDVDVMIDTEGEENIGSSIFVSLESGLTLRSLVFGDQLNFTFPIKNNEKNFKAYGFKFPGTFTGLVKFATLRLVENENVPKNPLKFNFDYVGSTTDWVDVYYMGGMDALKSIDNKEFVFSKGDCPSLNDLTGDVLSTSFDQNGHLMGLYNKIDDYVKQNKANVFVSWLMSNIYYVVSILMIILFVILLIILYKKGKLNKILKNNLAKNVN